MPTADQIKAMIRSHVEQDDERFLSIALQMAAHAARQGHGKVAVELREMVDVARKKRPGPTRRRPVAVSTPSAELAGLLSASAPSARLPQMVLDSELHGSLERVLREQRASDKLAAHGLTPARKLLLETDVLLMTGAPLGEPVAMGGSMVMNTQAEIERAHRDYRQGVFGTGWSPKSSDEDWLAAIRSKR